MRWGECQGCAACIDDDVGMCRLLHAPCLCSMTEICECCKDTKGFAARKQGHTCRKGFLRVSACACTARATSPEPMRKHTRRRGLSSWDLSGSMVTSHALNSLVGVRHDALQRIHRDPGLGGLSGHYSACHKPLIARLPVHVLKRIMPNITVK